MVIFFCRPKLRVENILFYAEAQHVVRWPEQFILITTQQTMLANLIGNFKTRHFAANVIRMRFLLRPRKPPFLDGISISILPIQLIRTARTVFGRRWFVDLVYHIEEYAIYNIVTRPSNMQTLGR